ncbi:MAG: UPF0280 family protein [Desulfobacula sp.]|nr:UPF0280 family protein [Desulfobacula sp.]
MFNNRTYRRHHKKKGLVSFDITVKETNLNIQTQTDLTDTAIKAILRCRNYIETYIKLYPEFATSLLPLKESNTAPNIIQEMIKAGRLTGTGPMASVAGAVAEYTGKALLPFSSEVVVENGGDIFIKSDSKTIFTVYAENTPFSMTCGILVEKHNKPYGICTSSGTLGHSKSFGKADAVTVLSESCSIADAAATALANKVQKKDDIQKAINRGKAISKVDGIVIIMGESIGLWGNLKLVKL